VEGQRHRTISNFGGGGKNIEKNNNQGGVLHREGFSVRFTDKSQKKGKHCGREWKGRRGQTLGGKNSFRNQKANSKKKPAQERTRGGCTEGAKKKRGKKEKCPPKREAKPGAKERCKQTIKRVS